MVAASSRYVAGVRLRSIGGIWFRHALVMRHTWLPSFTWYFLEPFVVLIAIGVGIGALVSDIDDIPYIRFVAPGIIVGSGMFHAIFECSWGSFFRIQKGVYETTLTAPVTTLELALGDISWAMSRAIITAICIGTVAAILGWIDTVSSVGVLLAAALTGMQFGALGLIFASLAPNVHILSLTFTVVASPLYFFSGAFFPYLRITGLGATDSLGRAAHTLRTCRARIRNRRPGYVPRAIHPLHNRPDSSADTHRLRPIEPPLGQIGSTNMAPSPLLATSNIGILNEPRD